MSYQDFLPTNWMKGRKGHENPLVALRKEVDSLFDDFGDRVLRRDGDVSIRSNMSETDKEFRITAELPGMTEADVEVSVTGNRIVIKGEKKTELEEEGGEPGREFHRIERASGAFLRKMALPFKIDPETVSADVKDGVLTVTVPKPPEAVEDTKKIPVTHAK